MSGSEQPYRWDLEDTLKAEDAWRSLNTTLPRSLTEHTKPEPRTIPDHKTTPLLKRATAQDLDAARAIVAEALNETAQLNKARVEQPLRNRYGLRPGTVVLGGGAAPGDDSLAAINKDVPPLLVITDKIAAAAALLAESQVGAALNGSGSPGNNMTRRATAASSSTGTYWMGG